MSGFVTLTSPLADLELDERRGHGPTLLTVAHATFRNEALARACGSLAPESAHLSRSRRRCGSLLIPCLVLAAAAALAVAATATGARPRPPPRRPRSPAARVDSLNLVSDGTLTIGADNPAFPPWFGGAEKTKPWKVSDPYSGKGYESAVAYAVAQQLGFPKSKVKWTVVPFTNSFRPGKKPFDFYLTQVSFTPERAKAVDFSNSYYFVNQSVVGRKGTADREGQVDRRPEAVQARRAGRDDELQLHQAVHPAVVEAARLRHERRGRPGAQERPDRRHRRRPADGVLRDGGAGRRRRDRRQAPDEGHEGALRDGASRRATRCAAASTGRSNRLWRERHDQEAAERRTWRTPARPT